MMKKTILILFLFICGLAANAQFKKYFEPRTLRMDYYHCGRSDSEEFFIKEIIQEPHWAGNTGNLIDSAQYGNQMLRVYDVASGSLIYSQGYCTLFSEWQTTPEASTTQKCYPEAVVMPFPKAPVRIEISSRDKQNKWVRKFEYTVDPDSYQIRKANPMDATFDVLYNGNAQSKVDIALLSEGYTDRAKFENDCRRFAEELFRYEPFKSRQRDFNIKGVWRASAQQGASIPGEHIWKQTALDARYYTFDSERYVMIDDLQKVRDMASNVPYDVIYILADTPKYGGGGVYNFYGISAAGNPSFAGKVYVHEFGHLFAGLGDEYVGGSDTEDMYRPGVEPWEENLTTLTDLDSKAWKSMIGKNTKIPTPDVESNDKVVGVYEGGGYHQTGVYRPWRNCMMRTIQSDDFCPVCTAALNKLIDKHTKQGN